MQHLRHFAWVCVGATLLVACSNGLFSSATPVPEGSHRYEGSAARPSAGSHYRILHAFGKSGDGAGPEAALIDVSGTLYGTTAYGGSYREDGGTVFDVDPATGSEHVLHSFGNGVDGAEPAAALIDVNGTFYGTTYVGGSYNAKHGGDGTLFSITPGGMESVLHSFGRIGKRPSAPLIDVNGLLYGDTSSHFPFPRGSCPCGAMFTMSTTGTEHLLHKFQGGPSDGSFPQAGLIDVNGTLYGTTVCGGTYDYPPFCQGGTIFSLNPSTGVVKLLHSFGRKKDGVNPFAGLLYFDGKLYGTTEFGGTNAFGTVFSIGTTGAGYQVLHNFPSVSGDGFEPESGLIAVDGVLYGVTDGGGAYEHYAGGTLFSITTDGTETVLHSFCGKGDICSPDANLLDVRGTLYGTASQNAARDNTGGVFAFTP